jgi:predicted MPP superfamily phosphohydrolase
MRPLTAAGLSAVAGAAACLAYGCGYEVRAFRLRRVSVPLLRPGERPLRILHVSDLHLAPRQRRKREWVRSLAGLDPDLVVNTGDNFGHVDAVPAILDALGPLLERPGVFVFGSNDYYSPVLSNPLGYLLGPSTRKPVPRSPDLPSSQLRSALVQAGWEYVGNARTRLKLDGRVVDVVGVDDPHVRRDRYDKVAGPADRSADLSVGVLHAPYTRVLDRMAADGHRLLLAGHTHGGQVCVPFYGALVTNCDLDRSRAAGLSRYRPGSGDSTETGRKASAGTAASDPPDREPAWLHVSAGLGTSPYAPVRFACPPEATLLTLLPRS